MFDAIVEDMEILTTKPRDEMAGGVGYGDADIHAIDGYANGWRLLSLADGNGRCDQQKQQDSQKWLSHFAYSSHSSKWTPLESFQEAPARK